MQLEKLGGREVSVCMNFLQINNACYISPSLLSLVLNLASYTRTCY